MIGGTVFATDIVLWHWEFEDDFQEILLDLYLPLREQIIQRTRSVNYVSALQFPGNLLGNLQNFKERLILDESSHFIWESNMRPLRGEKKRRLSRSKLKSVFLIESVA